MLLTKLQTLKGKFWQFHAAFWAVSFFVLLISGLSQSMSVDMAVSRNLSYTVLGMISCLTFLPLWERISTWHPRAVVIVLLAFAYATGSLSSLLVNHVMLQLFETNPAVPRSIFLFGGALNFSLVVLVWCGFYLFLKHGLSFEQGAEEQQAAKAIASISNMTEHPEFIALERLNKISLLPFSKITLIKAAGDYVEFSSEGETYLKRETLSNIEKILNPKHFQRVHRSAIVNLSSVKEMEAKGRGDYSMVLCSGENVACSRTYMDALKNRLDIAI